MYRGRYYLYECDLCNKSAYVKDFPDGWAWIKSAGNDFDMSCCCEDCLIRLPNDKKYPRAPKHPYS